MKYGTVFMLIALLLSGCSILTDSVARSMKAEQLYQKALAILNDSAAATINNAKAKEAFGYVDRAISLFPDETRYHCLKGIACTYLKEYDLAVQSFDVAIEKDSTNYRAWMGKGITYSQTAKYNSAIQCYLKAEQYDKHPTRLYANMGMAYRRLHKYSTALEYYTRCAQLEPDEKGVYSLIADVKQDLGRYDEALSDLDTAISAYPNDLALYNNRGLCKNYLKQYEGAIIDFEKAISIPASNEQDLNTKTYAYNNMANAYFALGKTDEACTYWNMAIEKGYQYQKEWKEEFFIDDPAELIRLHCR